MIGLRVIATNVHMYSTARTGAAQVLPMFGREVEEGNQALPVGNQRLHRLGVLGRF